MGYIVFVVLMAVSLAASGAPESAPQRAADEAPPAALSADEADRLAAQASQAEAGEIASEGAALGERLRAILAAVTAFGDIRAEVTAGVVVLRGVAPSVAAADDAARMAEKLDGVLLVVNEIAVEKDLARRLDNAWAAVRARLQAALGSLPLLLSALLVFAGFWLAARLLRDADCLYRLLSARTLLQNLLRQTVFVLVLLAGLVAALLLMDAGAVISTALGAAGVVGIALGFAFRNIVENYLAGILLAIRQPFRARDVVDIDGSTGTVLRMTTSETTLMDADGNHLRLPNALVFNGKVLNYTRNPLRRFTVAVGVGTNVELDGAQDLAIATLARMNGVVDKPAPSAAVVGLGDSSVLLEIYGWVDQGRANFAKVASEARRLVKTAFDEAGIDMPAPAYAVTLSAPLPDLPTPPERGAGVPPPTGPDPEEIDISTADDLAEQVEKELAQTGAADLLAAGAPDEAAPRR